MKKSEWIDGIYNGLLTAFNHYGADNDFTDEEDSISIQVTLEWLAALSESLTNTE